MHVCDLFTYSSHRLPTPYHIGTIGLEIHQKQGRQALRTVLVRPKEVHRAVRRSRGREYTPDVRAWLGPVSDESACQPNIALISQHVLPSRLHFTRLCRHSLSPDPMPLLPLSSDGTHQDQIKTPRAAPLQGLSTSTLQALAKRYFFTIFLSFFPTSFFTFHRYHLCHHPRAINVLRWSLSSFIYSLSRPFSRVPMP